MRLGWAKQYCTSGMTPEGLDMKGTSYSIYSQSNSKLRVRLVLGVPHRSEGATNGVAVLSGTC